MNEQDDLRAALGLSMTSLPRLTVSTDLKNGSVDLVGTIALYRSKQVGQKSWYLVYTVDRCLPGYMQTWVWGLNRAEDLDTMALKLTSAEQDIFTEAFNFITNYKGF